MRVRKTYERSPAGLLDALLDEMQDLRDDVCSAHDANAFANLADKALRSIEVEQRERAIRLAERGLEPKRLTHDV